MNIFVINGHKYYPYSKGKLNKTIFDEIVKILSADNEIKTTIAESGYDVDEEIEKFKWANLIIFQTPVNWYSVPWVLKKYLDEVYRQGVFYQSSLEYGKGGLFTDKKYMLSLTWGSPLSAFNNADGFLEGRDTDEMMIAMHKLQEFCGMKKIKTFSAFDVVFNPDIPRFLNDLKTHLTENIIKGN